MKLLKLNNIYNDNKIEYIDVEQICRIEKTIVTKLEAIREKKGLFNITKQTWQSTDFHGSLIIMKNRSQTYVLELPEQIINLIKDRKYISIK